MRNIKNIVLHCTLTFPTATVQGILRWWREEYGWNAPGYHYIYDVAGKETLLQSIHLTSNGARGFNHNSIHLAYIGGVKRSQRKNIETDTRSQEQMRAMWLRIRQLQELFPDARVLGHCDLPGVNKACPLFDVAKFMSFYSPENTY